MFDCTNCGATLQAGQTTCPICGAETLYKKTQRVCQNCGTPAAQDVQNCLMCGHPVDRLPRRATSFGASWIGVLLGLLIVGGLVYWYFWQFEPEPVAIATSTATPTQVFIPPTETSTPTVTATPRPAPTLTLTPTFTPAPIVHSIKTGETLIFIADKYNVTVDDILAVNNLGPDALLQVGQNLVIPFATDVNPSAPADDGGRERPIIRYTIKGGDTLSGIAFEYDTSMSAIELANPGLDLDLLSIGQEIVVPLRPPTFTPTPTVTPTPTFTPGPPVQSPSLLLPANETIIEGDGATVLLSWTATENLDANTFYVIHLTDDDGNTQTFWTQATSYRLPAENRPTRLTEYQWRVTVMEKIGIDEDGLFHGTALSAPGSIRTFQWR